MPMSSAQLPLLGMALATLVFPPLLHSAAHRSRALASMLDAYVVVAVGLLGALHLLPEAFAHGGLVAVAAAVVGATIPLVGKRMLVGARRLPLGVAAAGLLAHAFLDGAALHLVAPHSGQAMGLALLLHRLPIGLLLLAAFPGRLGALALLAVMGATGAGFSSGAEALTHIDETTLAWIQALVVGAIAHVVIHVHGPAAKPKHAHDGCCSATDHARSTQARWFRHATFAGSLLGFWTAMLPEHAHAHEVLHGTATRLLSLTLQTAPALCLAYLLAGVLSMGASERAERWLRGGNRFGQSLKGMAYGLPLPLCSCGVLPLYDTLVRRGVPTSAALAFLVATPELGIDAVLISLPLLGTSLTVARVLAAAAVALLVGVILGRVLGESAAAAPASASTEERATRPWPQRLRAGLRFGLVDLVDDTLPWVAVGLAVAALLEPTLSLTQLRDLPYGWQVPLFALIGIPLYVCAAGATPIAAAAIASGASWGAALAFLLTGPATNLTTVGVMTRLFDKRRAWIFALGVLLLATLAGLSVDLLALEPATPAPAEQHAGHGEGLLGRVAGAALALLCLGALWRKGPRGLLDKVLKPIHVHAH